MDEDNMDIKVIDNEGNLKDGQIKCPKCGSTDIETNIKTGKLRCNFCRHEFDPELAEADQDIRSLQGTTIRSGAKDIDDKSGDLITLKCESCGAEVVIDTKSSTQARCHWCRNTLSLNNQIPNGAVPDVILPFSVSKEEAREKISEFVRKRRFFAHPKFTREFTTDNICGVYMPYMLVDINGHMKLIGKGEIKTAAYEVEDDKGKTHIEYDVDTYQVNRDFNIFIDDLTIESSSDKLDYSSKNKTNNIINSIMPFDTENCLKFNSNYMKGYNSEKRDTNIGLLKKIVDVQSVDVARSAAKETITEYDRGVRWEGEHFDMKGDSWKSAYLPVWLYSYMQVKGDKHLLHYVAVNARTKETMGSVPINFIKLFITSVFVEIASAIMAFFLIMFAAMDTFKDTEFQDSRQYFWLLLITGFIFYYGMYLRYRNSNKRHHYESETKYEMSDLVKHDDFIASESGVRRSRIKGENTDDVYGSNIDLTNDEILKQAIEKDVLDEAVEVQERMEEMDSKS